MTLKNRVSDISVIAEIGWNFMGDIILAEEMISAAADAGAKICKFQYWNPEYLIDGPWYKDGRIEIYNKAKLDKEKISILNDICETKNVKFLVSVFSRRDAEFIRDLGINSIKIPSHESYNQELYHYVLSNFNEIYASLGACSMLELQRIHNLYLDLKHDDLKFHAMHCVSSYPCAEEDLNLPRIPLLLNMFGTSGLSDHSGSLHSGAVAVALGATVIEKHFTTDNNLPGRDNKFALATESFKVYVDNINSSALMMLDHGVEFLECEQDIIKNYRGRWAKGE